MPALIEALKDEGLPMAVRLLLAGDEEEALVLAPDGKVYSRRADDSQELALDPAWIAVSGEPAIPWYGG